MEKYSRLTQVINEAADQAIIGKGKQRHACDQKFEDQQICQLNRWLDKSPISGILFQLCKKALECNQLDPKAAIHELRGVINYAAAGIILMEERHIPSMIIDPNMNIEDLKDVEPGKLVRVEPPRMFP